MSLCGGRRGGGPAVLPSGGTARSWLRSTLFGEFLFLLLFAWGLFSACWWIGLALTAPRASLLMTTGCLWCGVRAAGGCLGRRWSMAVTLVLLSVLSLNLSTRAEGVPDWMLRSPVSPAVLAGMLGVLLCLDYSECRQRWLCKVSPPARRRWLGFELLLGLATIWVAWSFGAALYFHMGDLQLRRGGADPDAMSYAGRVAFHAGKGLVTFCVLALGGNIGSFLNVLVYRLPRGLDVVSGRSRCPVCGKAIAGRDNLPVFGWLLLGGRCRACGVEISSEYPRVEAVSAGIFLLLYFTELISGGLIVPFRPPNLYAGVLWTVMYPKFDLISLFLLHVSLLATLLTCSRLQSAGHGFSIKATGIPAALVLLGCSFFPFLQPVSVAAIPGLAAQVLTGEFGGPLSGMLSCLAGLFAGAAAAWILSRCLKTTGSPVAAVRSPFTAGLILTGAVLGWQAVLGVLLQLGLISALTSWWTDRPLRGECQRSGLLLLAVILQLLTWRWQWDLLSVVG